MTSKENTGALGVKPSAKNLTGLQAAGVELTPWASKKLQDLQKLGDSAAETGHPDIEAIHKQLGDLADLEDASGIKAGLSIRELHTRLGGLRRRGGVKK